MLVLSRRVDEDVVIDIPPGFSGRIRVIVSSIRDNKTRLAFDADRRIGIYRSEVLLREEPHVAPGATEPSPCAPREDDPENSRDVQVG